MPFLNMPQHRLQRAPVNPMDVSTIVSIFPKPVHEVKHTLQPGVFDIGAGTPENPAILHVGTCSWWKEMDAEQPPVEIPTSSVVVAKSVVDDYCNGILGCDMGDKKPGLFWVPGKVAVTELKTKKEYQLLIESAVVKQKNWYMELVRIADILWARTNGNPISIGDDMRLAAQEMNLKTKPWMGDFQTIQLTNCPACGHLRNSNFPVCSNCKSVIDKKKFEELGLKFAS